MLSDIELATQSGFQGLRAEMLLRPAQMDGRISRLEVRIVVLDAKVTSRLSEAVITVLGGSNLLSVTVATSIGTAVG